MVKSSGSRIKNSTWESFENADIVIENWDHSTNEIPFVVNFASKCGEQGDSIIFPSKFFLDTDRSNTLFGSLSNVYFLFLKFRDSIFLIKLIVNLWSQFRYGVYPEYASQNEEGKNDFFLNENGEIEPTRCSADIKGKIKNKFTNNDCENFLENGLPSPECIFEEDTNSNSFMIIPPSLIEVEIFILYFI